jgi:MYXO-CTERM domain-containing protein
MKRFGSMGRPLLTASLVFLVFACSGGGCSGCDGCGIAPIPGGFPIAERIPNAAQVRLSESGIEFIENNIGTIVSLFLEEGLNFDIPSTSGEQQGITYTVCPANDCRARGEIEDLDITTVPPNRLDAHLRVVLDSRNRAGARAPLQLDAGSATCFIDIDTRRGSRTYIGLSAPIAFENETRPARAGYTRLGIRDVALVDGEDIENADLDISSPDCGIFDVSCWDDALICNVANAGFVKNFVIGQLSGQVSGLIDDAVGEAMCTTRGEFGCPNGTFDRGNTEPDAVCYYEPSPPASGPDPCVSSLIGTDGRGDLGAQLLGGFSPGTHGTAQFLLASGGDGEAVENGMSLFMHGGFMSMDRGFESSPGHHSCVPVVEPPPLPDVARATAFRGNVIPGTTTRTHIGLGISEDYLNYAGYGMFDSGMLCIGAGTRLSQQLSTGLVSGIVPSLRNLAFPLSAAPLTLAIRPQEPPRFDVGTEAGTPLITITLPRLKIDWYVWSTERYVRFMTYQTDLTIRIDLTVEGGELLPRVSGVMAENSSVTEAHLITQNEDTVANAVQSILSGLADMLAGSIDPIALPDIMGFELDVPADGVRGVADSGEDFVGIFANLRLAGTHTLVSPVETRLELSDLSIDPASMSLESWGQGERNHVWLHMGAEGPSGVDYEYSYRINHGTWSAWTRSPRVLVDHDVLLLQARHTIEARARVLGQASTTDRTPASRELIIDVVAPDVQASREGLRAFVVQASDLISPESALRYRFLFPGAEWSEWQSSPRIETDELRLDGGELGIEVVDEAGNVGRATFPLIRGVPNPDANGGCACSAGPGAGAARPSWIAILFGLALVFSVVRRHRHGALVAIALMALGASGCECGSSVSAPCNNSCFPAVPPSTTDGDICCESTNMCVAYDVDALCMPGFTCPVANLVLDSTCDVSCGECVRKPPLEPGLLATDLDLVIASGGEIYVSGYSPGVPPTTRYGDLVFGEVSTTGEVAWEIVDGSPGGPVTNDPQDWRGGVSAPGDDVGRWTSIADSGSTLYIAYYDVTHRALRLAMGGPGAWNVQTVDDTADSGRYPSLVILDDGAPAIAYLRIDAASDGSGRPHSSVQVAIARTATPASATDWTIQEVTGSDMACRFEFCDGAQVCLESGACTVPTTDCAAPCDSDEACVLGACVNTLGSDYVEDLPPAYGLYTSLVRTATGLALVYYDRGRGNLWGAELPSRDGVWSAPFLIDGYAVNNPERGDSGLGASLFIDSAGTWHVAYVDGTEEALRYVSIAGGVVGTPETVDRGETDGATPHSDGRHIVGDDASIVVTEGGEIRIVYQDATSQRLMLARRPSSGGAWSISVLDMEHATGFWAVQKLVGTISYVATFWRRESRTSSANGVRVLSVP